MNCTFNARSGLRAGYTLIEILVVLAIITVLVALLFPVIGSVRERSRQSVCASNLKQLYLAFAQYAGDHEGHTPPYSNNIDQCGSPAYPGDIRHIKLPERGSLLVGAMLPYTKSHALWFCPTDALAHTDSQAGYLDRRFSSYHSPWRLSLNQMTTLWPLTLDNYRGHPPVSGDGISEAAIFLSDESWTKPIYFNVSPSGQETREPTEQLFSHNGFSNCLFFDGHLKAYPSSFFMGFNRCGGITPLTELP